jgi:hypothetical protein
MHPGYVWAISQQTMPICPASNERRNERAFAVRCLWPRTYPIDDLARRRLSGFGLRVSFCFCCIAAVTITLADAGEFFIHQLNHSQGV